MRRTVAVVLLACSACLAQTAGKVDKLLPAGFLIHDKNTAEAKAADLVFWNDIARTNDKGRMRLALNDGSLLTVGSKAELRVVKHDTASQQTMIELLYGSLRAKVASLTKPDSSFQVHTPTAVIGAIGTETVVIARSNADVSQTITAQQIQDLPTAGRDLSTLAQLTPGATPADAGGAASIADFAGVDETDVYALDHVVGVRNIDSKVQGLVFLSPGEMTRVRRGQPPTPPVPFDFHPDSPQRASSQPQYPLRDFDFGCYSDFIMDGKILASSDPRRVGQPVGYSITGRGTGSTGKVLQAKFENPTGCEMNILMRAGSVLQPSAFTGGIKGVTHSSYQIMLTFGGFWTIPPPAPSPAPGASFFLPPEPAEPEIQLQAYCLERTKLAPHPGTAYRFADPSIQSQFAAYQKFVDKAHELFLKGEMNPAATPLDLVVQWAIWIHQENMPERVFREAHWKLVEQNLEQQHRKLDKDLRQRVEAAQADIWSNAQKLIAASR